MLHVRDHHQEKIDATVTLVVACRREITRETYVELCGWVGALLRHVVVRTMVVRHAWIWDSERENLGGKP